VVLRRRCSAICEAVFVAERAGPGAESRVTMTTENEPIDDVLIVGGGTAGWMTAAYLVKLFGERLRITVLESPTIPKIGVGEATVPNLQHSFFDVLGIPEDEWMKEVNGAFKTAVKFVNWRKRAPGEPSNHFYHNFGVLPYVDGVHLALYWYYLTRGRGEPFAYACYREPMLMDAKLAPKSLDGRSAVAHAWHFDAHLVADFLRRWATERGVTHVLDHVRNVELDERGHVARVRTRFDRTLAADLFVDCTGFKRMLIEKVLLEEAPNDEAFIDMGDRLLCNRAVAASIPHDDATHGIEPYTSAIAMKAGWTWKIPMLGRFGSGYVYSSDHLTEDEAAHEFCALWKLDEDEVSLNRITFHTGRLRATWAKNCVAIGLSSCFLEPLESTGIYFITASIHQLAKHFPTKAMEPGLASAFNREVEFMFDDCRDFLQAHYFTSSRDDSDFWLRCKTIALSDSMNEKIATYKAGMPINPPPVSESDYYATLDNEFRRFWLNESYYCIFSGMGFLPDHPMGMLAYRPAAVEEAKRVLAGVRARGRQLASILPSNYEYLQQFHAGTMMGERSPALGFTWRGRRMGAV
jgi:hypothetical protein